MFLDATHCKALVNRRVAPQAVVIATGVTADTRREASGSTSAIRRTGRFDHVRAYSEGPGACGVQLAIRDAHTGPKAATSSMFLGASWQG